MKINMGMTKTTTYMLLMLIDSCGSVCVYLIFLGYKCHFYYTSRLKVYIDEMSQLTF